MKKHHVFFCLSICCFIVLWQILSVIIDASLIIPSPISVFFDMGALLRSKNFFPIVGTTFFRGVTAFFISFALSCVLGFFAGKYTLLASMLKPWLIIIKSTPVVSIIIIALLWFGSSYVPIFVSVLMTLPIMTESILSGIASTDTKLIAMSKIYNFSSFSFFKNISVPTTLPFLVSSAGASLGLTWKVVVAGEIIGFPRYGLGSAIQIAKIHLETPRVFSLTIIAIFLSMLTDILFSMLVKKSRKHIELGSTHGN